MNECFDSRVKRARPAQDSFDTAASPDACDTRSTGPRGGFACLHWLDRHQWQWTAHPHIAFEAMRLVLWHLQHNDRLIYLNLTRYCGYTRRRMKDGLIWTGQRPMSDTGEMLKGMSACPLWLQTSWKWKWFFFSTCVHDTVQAAKG